MDFEPIAMIPSGTKFTAFHSDNLKGSAAHRSMENNEATGKLVVLP